MLAPLIVISGTGTSIGKTHISCALLQNAGQDRRVFGYKPIESGIIATSPSDAKRLADASTFHVQHWPGVQLAAPLSPDIAATLEGKVLDWSAVVAFTFALRADGVSVLVELPGGLFTPITPQLRNIDGVLALEPTATLVIAPDRLGVLHDVGAVIAGANHIRVPISAIGLVMPDQNDASTGRNAEALRRLLDVPVLGPWPRAPVEALRDREATATAVRLWLGLQD
jgi:dethiobiotin synthetase